MRVSVVDPEVDRRYDDLVDADPRASVFHSRSWIEALRRTYGWRTLLLTTSRPDEPLVSGLPVCHVTGWFGSRLVSLPFSDHCEPLFSGPAERDAIAGFLRERVRERLYRSVELRPVGKGEPSSDAPFPGLTVSARHCLHRLDLSGGADAVFRRFHKSCMQRAIRRAEREGLHCQTVSSPRAIRQFHRLLRMSRRRHGVLPQPIAWFENLAASFGERFRIRMAMKEGQPVAAIVTLTCKNTIVYKYGGSDSRLHHLGGMPLLLWLTVKDAAAAGLQELDLGRSDVNQSGLLAFKDHMGARRSALSYFSYPGGRRLTAADNWASRAARRIVAQLPDPAFAFAGRVLYRHFG